MMNISEISRRSMINTDSGFACGPFDMTVVDAEIVVSDQGHNVFLHAQWVSEADDLISFSATLESLYDVYDKLNKNEGDEDALIAERDRIEGAGVSEIFPGIDIFERYDYFYHELISMIKDTLSENDYDIDIFDEDDEDFEE